MNVKEKLKNDVLIGMRMYLDAMTLGILEQVILQACRNIEMTEIESLPATVDDTNSYILEMLWQGKQRSSNPRRLMLILGQSGNSLLL